MFDKRQALNSHCGCSDFARKIILNRFLSSGEENESKNVNITPDAPWKYKTKIY